MREMDEGEVESIKEKEEKVRGVGRREGWEGRVERKTERESE